MTEREKIKALMLYAQQAGDLAQVELCKRALGKRAEDADAGATTACLRVIASLRMHYGIEVTGKE